MAVFAVLVRQAARMGLVLGVRDAGSTRALAGQRLELVDPRILLPTKIISAVKSVTTPVTRTRIPVNLGLGFAKRRFVLSNQRMTAGKRVTVAKHELMLA